MTDDDKEGPFTEMSFQLMKPEEMKGVVRGLEKMLFESASSLIDLKKSMILKDLWIKKLQKEEDRLSSRIRDLEDACSKAWKQHAATDNTFTREIRLEVAGEFLAEYIRTFSLKTARHERIKLIKVYNTLTRVGLAEAKKTVEKALDREIARESRMQTDEGVPEWLKEF